MVVIKVIQTNRTSTCVNCGEDIEPGTNKILFDGYRRYKSAHLDCVGVQPKPANTFEDLEDNPYEQAFPEEKDRLLDDITETLESGMSRPEKAEEIHSHAQAYLNYAKNTEQVADQ